MESCFLCEKPFTRRSSLKYHLVNTQKICKNLMQKSIDSTQKCLKYLNNIQNLPNKLDYLQGFQSFSSQLDNTMALLPEINKLKNKLTKDHQFRMVLKKRGKRQKNVLRKPDTPEKQAIMSQLFENSNKKNSVITELECIPK